MTGNVPFSAYADINPHRHLRRGESYPFVEMAAIPEGGGRVRYHQKRVFDGGGTRFTIGDTLFARITPCTENGKVARVTDLDGFPVAFGSTEFIVLSAKDEESDPSFVYQVAVSDRVRKAAVRRMLGSSGRQRVPNWFFHEELMLPRFSLGEQRAIAAILDSIDEAIERTEEVIAATDALRLALLQDLLTNGVPGWHKEWDHVPGIGTIPADWGVTTVGSIAKFTSGSGKPSSEYFPKSEANSIPIFGGNGISGYTSTPLVTSPVVVIGRVGQKCGSVHYTEGAAWITDNALYSKEIWWDVATPFLALLLEHARLNDIRNRNDLPLLTQAIVHSVAIAVPSRREQDEVVALSELLATAVAEDREVAEQLRAVKASLGDALLTGRARVPAR